MVSLGLVFLGIIPSNSIHLDVVGGLNGAILSIKVSLISEAVFKAKSHPDSKGIDNPINKANFIFSHYHILMLVILF
ncbi:hypothetical protein Xsze_04044 [Xenorhabdus szentirmaii DSM 16338]|nr:hypothetical protein Xsze_04044 [Xenorhabdus szentirmaii DSM 16338]